MEKSRKTENLIVNSKLMEEKEDSLHKHLTWLYTICVYSSVFQVFLSYRTRTRELPDKWEDYG